MAVNEFQEKLLNAIEIIVTERLKSLSSSMSYVIYGIVSSVDTTNKKATCKINEQSVVIPYVEGLTLAVNNIVVILVPNGVYQDKFILCKKNF